MKTLQLLYIYIIIANSTTIKKESETIYTVALLFPTCILNPLSMSRCSSAGNFVRHLFLYHLTRTVIINGLTTRRNSIRIKQMNVYDCLKIQNRHLFTNQNGNIDSLIISRLL
jgi:hypothetical protein